jgi:hypothetical protein
MNENPKWIEHIEAIRLAASIDNENLQSKYNFTREIQDIAIFFYREFAKFINKFVDVVFRFLTPIIIPAFERILTTGLKGTLEIVIPLLFSLFIIFGVILLLVYLFLLAWTGGDGGKASNEFKKLFGDTKKEKNPDTSLSNDSYLSKFNLKNIITNFFIFFEIDNILNEDELKCREIHEQGNCDDIKNISGKYISDSMSKDKCYNLIKPENIEWNLNEYTPHHYNKLKLHDNTTNYPETVNITDEKYNKHKVTIEWNAPDDNNAEYYKLSCGTFKSLKDNTEFSSGLICANK